MRTSRLRVLTFNFHEPYLCLMAKTGLTFTVGLYDSGELRRDWHTAFRPVPPNIHLAPETQWRRDLHDGKFDVLVAHNEVNAASVYKSNIPALLLCHNRRSMILENFPPDDLHEREAYGRLLRKLQDRFDFVFISESKRDDYGIPGPVILPGIDVEQYGGYQGDRLEVLRVGNAMRERNRMFDVEFQETVVAAFPNRVLGNNPGIPGARPAGSFDDLLWHYRHLRCYLHVSREQWEDGYNLAMIEAMACAMPVVSLANPSSPITDGVDGFSSYNAADLREYIRLLFQNPGMAREIGRRGRDTVARAFPIQRFVDNWRRLLEQTAEAPARLPWLKQTPPDADTPGRFAQAGTGHAPARRALDHPRESTMRDQAPVETPADTRLQVGGYYRSPRPELAEHVPVGTARLLDVGCGAGEFGRALKEHRGVREVVGVEIVERAWEIAKDTLDAAILGNIEHMTLPFPDGHFDCITCGDVLEHLVEPLDTLKKLKRVLAPNGVIVASIPNARFYQVVEMLANGRWMYQDAGILDRTHLRFFTAVEMIELFRDAGLRMHAISPLTMMPQEALPISPDRYIQLQKLRIGPLDPHEYRDFLVYQYVVIAGRAGAQTLDMANAYLENKENEQALDAARQARDHGEDDAACLRIMGKACARLGRVAESEAHYRQAVALRPDDGELRGEYALVLIAQGRIAEAHGHLREAHEMTPANARVLSGLGLCELTLGNLAQGYAYFRESLDFEFNNGVALDHLVDAARALGCLPDAEPYVRRFMEFYPGKLEVALMHATLLAELNRDHDARARIETILLFEPQHAAARALLEQIDARQ